ncbi:hypothetical protein PV10_00501 [Exophiala mesophila]|uniref:U3 small nucleolar RNA-associated protein 22 n=1 Tax=Exophiala mesophila TaxID=212818 RepID=A0A0D2ACI2_EXOME|nr:uncharacterized protein PV10_00501 [Exophiala mesophila]KIV96663.1 hypothetical protein PV10_00501 [Exophiala mesophila]
MSVNDVDTNGHSPKRRKVSHEAKQSKEKSGSLQEGAQDSNEPLPSARQVSNHKPRSNSFTKMKAAALPAGGVSKSSIIALQISDLSTEVTPEYDSLRHKWTPVVRNLESVIKQIPERKPISGTEAAKSFRKQGITIPFPEPRPTKDTNYKFEFKPPSSIKTRGALVDNLSVKHENLIDIRVIMPESLFQEKDYLNNRAFHKAAFYLSCIALSLKESYPKEFDWSFSHQHDLDLLPIVCLIPRDPQLAKFTFQISVGFPSAVIPIEKTSPTKVCLRNSTVSDDESDRKPVPVYNGAIRYAASSSSLAERTKLSRSPAFDESCRVAQIWLRQRGFSSAISEGGFGFDEWSHICGLLLQQGGHRNHPLFSKQYSSLQFLKAMLQILAVRDLRDPWIIGDIKVEIPRSDVPVLYDVTNGFNVLYKMTPWSYERLRHHAQLSLTALNTKHQDNFESIFLFKVAEPFLQYDEVLSINIPGKSFASTAERVQYLQRLYSVISRGLGDRTNLINFTFPKAQTWPLKHDHGASTTDIQVEVGLLINADNITRLVDHGPSADEQQEAAEFREFWGEKAELRRFKDGSISESLVWLPGTPVTLQIIKHLVLQHFKLLPSSVTRRSRDLQSDLLEEADAVSTKDAFRLINNTYQSLTSTLHGLQGLPLPIRSISPADAALRSSTIDNPLIPPASKPIDILIQFDSSARWPDSLPAIQHTKIAFLLKVSELLSSSDQTLTTRIGLENTTQATSGYFNTSFLDIIYPSGGPGISPICFRARILHDRESHLLQTALSDKTLHGSVRDSINTALTEYKSAFLASPIHTTTIRTLCTRFPPLSGTIRLLKKWISSHRLLDHIPPEILEILAAQTFLQPTPWAAPGSCTTAFLRCLHLLSRWDWTTAPLVVDLSLGQEMSSSQVDVIKTRFQAWRKLDPSFNKVVWCVGTNLDETGTVWTGNGRVERVVASRVRALASAAIDRVRSSHEDGMDAGSWDGLFVGDLENYDFIIRLKRSVTGNARSKRRRSSAGEAVDSVVEYKNLQIGEALDIDSIGFDAVQLYLEDLRFVFGHTALFFHDGSAAGANSVIAGLWRPSVKGEKEWRVRLGWSSVPLPIKSGDGDEEDAEKFMCTFNGDAVLAEMAALGEGLVKEIKGNE